MLPQPSNLRLLHTLQSLFIHQAREVMSRITLDHVESGELPDTSHWNATMARIVEPLLLPFWQHGMLRSQLRIARLLRKPVLQEPNLLLHAPEGRRFITMDQLLGKGVMWSGFSSGHRHQEGTASLDVTSAYGHSAAMLYAVLKAANAPKRKPVPPSRGAAPSLPAQPRLTAAWDLYNPKVIDAVNAATLRFCRETNETATMKLREATVKLRELLRRGLKRGEAVQVLARKVREIYADPFRAFRIASTETSRAVHGGGILAAKENPEVGGKRWLASADACDACLDLDGEERLLDEPFWVDPKGGIYAVVMHPPLHPHCQCDQTEVLGTPKKRRNRRKDFAAIVRKHWLEAA